MSDNKGKLFARLLDEVSNSLKAATSSESALESVVKILSSEVEYFTWTGFYLIDGDELHLGPYVGKPTPHTRIKVGQGICGSAAEKCETIIVDDVDSDPRYLACSLETKSEIVVPLMDEDKCLGEIDIDSDSKTAFSEVDAEFLERVAALVTEKLKSLVR
ncbi:MAG: GAF domain-containing protein [candidate division Zixibacteria bacterium]|nr:GAF domain-containing protein [candidate division Zixibacteria bacterium]